MRRTTHFYVMLSSFSFLLLKAVLSDNVSGDHLESELNRIRLLERSFNQTKSEDAFCHNTQFEPDENVAEKVATPNILDEIVPNKIFKPKQTRENGIDKHVPSVLGTNFLEKHDTVRDGSARPNSRERYGAVLRFSQPQERSNAASRRRVTEQRSTTWQDRLACNGVISSQRYTSMNRENVGVVRHSNGVRRVKQDTVTRNSRGVIIKRRQSERHGRSMPNVRHSYSKTTEELNRNVRTDANRQQSHKADRRNADTASDISRRTKRNFDNKNERRDLMRSLNDEQTTRRDDMVTRRIFERDTVTNAERRDQRRTTTAFARTDHRQRRDTRNVPRQYRRTAEPSNGISSGTRRVNNRSTDNNLERRDQRTMATDRREREPRADTRTARKLNTITIETSRRMSKNVDIHTIRHGQRIDQAFRAGQNEVRTFYKFASNTYGSLNSNNENVEQREIVTKRKTLSKGDETTRINFAKNHDRRRDANTMTAADIAERRREQSMERQSRREPDGTITRDIYTPRSRIINKEGDGDRLRELTHRLATKVGEITYTTGNPKTDSETSLRRTEGNKYTRRRNRWENRQLEYRGNARRERIRDERLERGRRNIARNSRDVNRRRISESRVNVPRKNIRDVQSVEVQEDFERGERNTRNYRGFETRRRVDREERTDMTEARTSHDDRKFVTSRMGNSARKDAKGVERTLFAEETGVARAILVGFIGVMGRKLWQKHM